MAALRLLLLFAALLGFAFLLDTIRRVLKRRFPHRTVANWTGSAFREDCSPAEAALLIGLHPSLIVATALREMARAGLLRIDPGAALRMEWTGRAPSGPVEQAARELAGAASEDREEAGASLLEAIYARVNEGMIGYSGTKSVRYVERVVDALWDAALEAGRPDPAAVSWLAFRDSNRAPEIVREAPEWEVLRAAYRENDTFREKLFRRSFLRERIAAAEEGFFAWRRDLLKVPSGGIASDEPDMYRAKVYIPRR